MSEDDNIKQLDDVNKYSTEQFDKNILFIASGALGISFAFIKDIIPDLSKAVDKDLLVGSWFIFASVIFISLVTHFVAMQASLWGRKNNHLEYELYNAKIKWWNIPIRFMNISTILLILIGAVLLILFIERNI